jgi:hypothetical protein
MGKPPGGSDMTNPGQPPNAMLPGTPPPPGNIPDIQGGPMGIPGYTPGSLTTPPPGGAPPVMPGNQQQPGQPQQQNPAPNTMGQPTGVPPGPQPGGFKFPPMAPQPNQGQNELNSLMKQPGLR